MSHQDEVEHKLAATGDERDKLDRPSRKLSGRITDHQEPPGTKKKGYGGSCESCPCFSPYPGWKCGAGYPVEECDVLLIGGGIMSATMGLLLKQLEPGWNIKLFERLSSCGEESSNGWNNAGTGHSALCELNYTKEDPKTGEINATKAFQVNEQFQLSRQFWAHLARKKLIDTDWIQSVAHMSFVTGEKNVRFLRKRHALLSKETLFKGMEISEDARQISQWAPLLIKDRKTEGQAFAATYMAQGTDVDFGILTKQMIKAFSSLGGSVYLFHTVTDIKKTTDVDYPWIATVKKESMGGGVFKVKSKFIFAGAGGWALLMLQKAGIPAVHGYAGGPVSGQFLVCQNPTIVKQHQAKVYTKGEIGAPPMSEPHLDARIIEGKQLLLFGPYAGINTRFLKNGNLTDAFKMIKYHNLIPLTCAALQNFDLVLYLVGMLAATQKSRMKDLHQIMPSADPDDWTLITAGMRVQVIKKDPASGKYIFQFGTEVVFGPEKNICGLLGASPGASTAVQVCFDILQKAYPTKVAGSWHKGLKEMVPSFGMSLSSNANMAREVLEGTAKDLKIKGMN